MAYLWSGALPGDRASGPGTDELRDRWRSRSMEEGWSLPSDWWSPAVEAVVTAVHAGHGMAVACARLGQARGRAGVGIGETLDDLGALFSVLSWPDPPLSLVRCAAEGWVDSGLMDLAGKTCEDPLTGLMTLSYLRSRLSEIYRAAAALGGAPETAVGDTHCLVMVDLSDGSEPWRRLARAVVVAHDLRAVFDGGETLTLVGTGRAAALVPVSPRLVFNIAALRRLLTQTLTPDHPDGHGESGPGGVLVWVERLPDDLEEAQALLEVLAR
ncbi:hypothetical protein J4573_19105 [Actinomadura barringtoniae]|uniref:GGDEF domain-containing protein n=1 Tax=Actinomadura barringtoniae TaxID=1427535 RepID=A0A939PIL3_9ACTN|nr:hypothetical protein [Actinomadura barringtoniae]MBO2449221.1 hypothetical protein [Actinomadura barringtoniae]